jgi:hypothetical protein
MIQTVDVWVLASFSGRIKDLDGDGHSEVVLPVKLDPGDYRGARPTAVWPAVYAWSSGRFVDASSRFADYYRHGVLPDLDAKLVKDREQLTKLGVGVEGDELEQDIAATTMVRDKIARVTGERADAGVDRARQWMTSGSADLRQDAAAVFGDTGRTSELETLARDPDPEVAAAAKRAANRTSRK